MTDDQAIMKVWANCTLNVHIIHYVKEPEKYNLLLGSVIQHPGKPANWFCGGKFGEANTIEEAKKRVEKMCNDN